MSITAPPTSREVELYLRVAHRVLQRGDFRIGLYAQRKQFLVSDPLEWIEGFVDEFEDSVKRKTCGGLEPLVIDVLASGDVPHFSDHPGNLGFHALTVRR